MRRKLLSVVLCVCMMLTMAPFAFAADGTKGTENNPYSLSEFNALTREQYKTAQEALGGTMYVNVGEYSYEQTGILGNGERNDTPGQRPDGTKMNAYGENGYLGDQNDGANGKNVVFVGTSITSGVKGYSSIDSIGTSLLLAVPAYTNVTFKDITFNNVFSFDYQLYTSPWSQLGSLNFEGCTFNGIIVGAIASQALKFDGCTFTNYTNSTSANNSNPTWIRPAYGNWTKDDNEGQGNDFRSLTDITFTNNTVTSTRPVKFERIAQWEMPTTVTATGNTFSMSQQESDTKTKNIGMYFGAEAKFTLIADNNTKTGDTAALYTLAEKQTSLPAGSTVKNSKDEKVTLTDALEWKTNNPIELKSSYDSSAVAVVNDTAYSTLASAVAAAKDGGTIDLLKNASEYLWLKNGEDVTLNLNGYTLSSENYPVYVKHGKLTVNGPGIIKETSPDYGAILIKGSTNQSDENYSIVTVNKNVTLEGWSPIFVDQNSAKAYGVTVNLNSVTLNAKNDTSNALGAGIYVNGQITDATNAPVINLDSTTITSTGHGMYLAGCADTTVNNCNITGNQTGIEIRAGKLAINGASVTGNGTPTEITPNGNGSTAVGAGIAVMQHTTKLPITVDISDGTISGYTGLLESNPQNNSEEDLAKVSINVTGGKFAAINGGTNAVSSDDKTGFISGGLFSKEFNKSYCTTGLTIIDNTDENTKATYPKTVGTITANNDNEVVTATTTGTTVATVGDGIQTNDVENATAVGNSVAPAANTTISDTTQITENDKQQALTALVANDKVTLDNNNIPEGTTITAVKEIYLDVQVTEYDSTNSKVAMDITPKYNLIAVAKTGDSEKKITLKSAQDTTVTAATKVSVTLPTAFANQKVYITHKNDIYIATADKNGKIEFTTNGFSPFTFSLSNSDVVAEVNGNAYKTLQEAADAAKDGEEINIVKNDTLNLNFTDTKSVKVTNKTSDKITVKFNGVNKDVAKDATETFTYTRPSSGGPGSSGGSISTPTTYAVNVNAATNGAVAADKKTASKGTTVTVTASPSKGYVVDAVKVVDKDGKDVAVTEKDGKYVFTMPGSAVTVTGSFKAETPAPVALPFTDVKSGNWFYDAVKYAYEQGLMTGTSATTFAPNGTMNRAMIVTVLYRLEKSPAVTGASKFTDVPAGQWYSDAVAWAAANKIVNGYDETTFGPMNAVTREQMAAILFRYEQVKGLENVTLEENLNRFPDQNKISAYAIPALQWAVGQKIINGNADGTLDPTGTATRAQVAQIFTNLLNK